MVGEWYIPRQGDLMTEPTVLYEERGAVAVATLNRPQSLNSFTRQMHRELGDAMARVENNPVIRALVITGAGRGLLCRCRPGRVRFAPGPDMVARADPGPIIDQAFNPTVRRLQALRVPTVAAVNGVAAGAGASLAMTCDIAIAAPGASFIQAFSKIGLIPDAGGSWFLVERLGLARAMALAMTGDKLSATQARDWGMIWDVAEEPMAAAAGLAERLSVMPTRPGGHTTPVARRLHRTLHRSWTQSAILSRRWAHARLHRRRDGFPAKAPGAVQRRMTMSHQPATRPAGTSPRPGAPGRRGDVCG
jgi:2-(1,2-epoxy-1,2-dihydrophenyl)acetyl-CoA isomerase